MKGLSNKHLNMDTSLAKFKVSVSDSQILIRSTLKKRIDINQKDIAVFNSKFIRGLMRPKVISSTQIEYSAPGNMLLTDFLRSGINKNDFFVVFAQFVECLKKVEWNGFKMENLLMSTDYIFYNSVTKEVQFIYQPLINQLCSYTVFSFIYELANNTVLVNEEDSEFLGTLVKKIRHLPMLSIDALEHYIIITYPQIYNQVKRSKPGQSQSLVQTGRTYFKKKYDEDTSMMEITDNSDDSNDFGTALLFDDDNQENTSFLCEEEPDTTALLCEEECTTRLDESEGTSLEKNKDFSFPYLIRLNNFEKVFINKPVFRIGKEMSYVDYFVKNNSAVSRIHADIITKNNHCFVKDENSTNYTFLNGKMINPNEEIEIFDGDALMLANEPFEFHKN